MKGQIIKAISEVHSGDIQEAEKITDIITDLYKHEILPVLECCTYELEELAYLSTSESESAACVIHKARNAIKKLEE